MSVYSDLWIDEHGHGAVRLVVRAHETPPKNGEKPRWYQNVMTVVHSELEYHRLNRHDIREYFETQALYELAQFCAREQTWIEKPTLEWEQYDAVTASWRPYMWPEKGKEVTDE